MFSHTPHPRQYFCAPGKHTRGKPKKGFFTFSTPTPCGIIFSHPTSYPTAHPTNGTPEHYISPYLSITFPNKPQPCIRFPHNPLLSALHCPTTSTFRHFCASPHLSPTTLAIVFAAADSSQPHISTQRTHVQHHISAQPFALIYPAKPTSLSIIPPDTYSSMRHSSPQPTPRCVTSPCNALFSALHLATTFCCQHHISPQPPHLGAVSERSC